jgi:hypothetical protein
MKNLPRHIYLNFGCSKDEFKSADFNDLEEVTWSKERVNDTDTQYIGLDIVKQLLKKQREECERSLRREFDSKLISFSKLETLHDILNTVLHAPEPDITFEGMLKERVIDFILSNNTDGSINDAVNEAIPDFLDDDWQSDGYVDEYDWYADYGHGEAEDQVRMEVEQEVFNEFQFLKVGEDQADWHNNYQKITGEFLWQTINDLFPQL